MCRNLFLTFQEIIVEHQKTLTSENRDFIDAYLHEKEESKSGYFNGYNKMHNINRNFPTPLWHNVLFFCFVLQLISWQPFVQISSQLVLLPLVTHWTLQSWQLSPILTCKEDSIRSWIKYYNENKCHRWMIRAGELCKRFID